VFPVFSERVDHRDIRTVRGRLVGEDRWGQLKAGERWRYVTFLDGDAVGYWPVPPEQATVLDRVINSACFPGHPEDTSNGADQ